MALLDRQSLPASSMMSAAAEEKQLREAIGVMEQQEVPMGKVYKGDMQYTCVIQSYMPRAISC